MEKNKFLEYFRNNNVYLTHTHGIGGTQKFKKNIEILFNNHNIKTFNFHFSHIFLFNKENKILFIFFWHHLFIYSILKFINYKIVYRPNSIESRYLSTSKKIKDRIYVNLYKFAKKYLPPDLIVCQSKEIETEWSSFKTIIIYNFELFYTKPKITVKNINLNKGLFVGRDHRVKQVDETIDILNNHNISVDFFLTGKERNIELKNGKIVWNNLIPSYSSYDFLIITSLYEAFPNVVIEACLNGIPVFGLKRIKILEEINDSTIMVFDSIEDMFIYIKNNKTINFDNSNFIEKFALCLKN